MKDTIKPGQTVYLKSDIDKAHPLQVIRPAADNQKLIVVSMLGETTEFCLYYGLLTTDGQPADKIKERPNFHRRGYNNAGNPLKCGCVVRFTVESSKGTEHLNGIVRRSFGETYDIHLIYETRITAAQIPKTALLGTYARRNKEYYYYTDL